MLEHCSKNWTNQIVDTYFIHDFSDLKVFSYHRNESHGHFVKFGDSVDSRKAGRSCYAQCTVPTKLKT